MVKWRATSALKVFNTIAYIAEAAEHRVSHLRYPQHHQIRTVTEMASAVAKRKSEEVDSNDTAASPKQKRLFSSIGVS